MEEIFTNPIYLDWSFWAVIFAVIAIVLSQIPPIHLLLKRSRIDFEVYSKINITHTVGNPNIQLHLIISNIGGRKVKIKGITAKIIREDNLVTTLPAQNYLQNLNDKSAVLFTTFSLNPSEEWGHLVNLFKPFDREEERGYRKMERDLKLNIFEKDSQVATKPKKFIEADSKYVNPFVKFFEKRFVWKSGEYELFISIQTDQSHVDIEKAYRFTLFESHEEELRTITHEYKYGAGIYWTPETQTIPTSVIVAITES